MRAASDWPLVALRRPRDIATRPVRTISSTPYGPQHFEQAVDLVFGAGDFDDQRVGRHVHDPRAEHIDELHDVRARFGGRRNLDHRQVAEHRRRSA